MNDLILLESVSARNEKLTALTQDTALDHLNKAKSLVMAMWQGMGVATTEQMADYYDVSVDAIESVIRRNKDELQSDGLKVLKGKELKEVVVILTESQTRIPSLTIWTPRAALRLGMLLRDSEVAKQVRTVLLDLAQIVPQQQEHIHELQLRLELAQAERDSAIAQKHLIDTRKAITDMGNQTLSALILGATVITDKTPVERTITSDGRVFEGVGITAIAQKLGYGKNTKACWQWLDSIGYGKSSRYWEEQLAAIVNHKLKPDAYDEILTKWNQGNRQRFIGE